MIAVVYGVVAYVLFLGTIACLIGFTGNLGVGRSSDGGTAGPVAQAVIVDLLLLGAFAAQHSLMARQSFKRWWTRIVPHSVERSTFVLFSSLVLLLLYWQWRPIAAPIWRVSDPVGATLPHLLFWMGGGTAFLASFPLSPFALLGLSQVPPPQSGPAPRAPRPRA